MEIRLNVPEYNPQNGIKYLWENGFEIHVEQTSKTVSIIANKEGLISLANHLLNLAQDNVPTGFHLHFDETNSLEDGSSELIFQKK